VSVFSGTRPFDEQVGEFDEEAELGDAGDQAVEVFAHAVLHELDLLPLHEFALGFVGATLGVAGFLGDVVEFVEWMGPPSGASASRCAAWSRRLDHGEGAASGSGPSARAGGRRRYCRAAMILQPALHHPFFLPNFQYCFQNSMHDQVGIAADGRGEVRIA